MSDYPTDAALERAARRLCEIRGIDPDAKVGHAPDPVLHNGQWITYDVYLQSPQWRMVAKAIRAHLEVEQALRETAEEQPPKIVGKSFGDWLNEQ